MEAATPQTLAEKIVARASGRASVVPGELVTVAIDLAMAHDSSGPRRWRPALERLGARLWDPDRVVIVSDHYAPASDAASAAILDETRRFAADYGVRRFHDGQGICHVVLPERGHLRPGMMAAGGDSHSCTAGAYACLMIGFGATDMVGVVVTGRTWLVTPATARVELRGAFQPGVAAKDVMLLLAREMGQDNAGHVIEFAGPAVSAMPMGGRMTLCNMAAELGADTALIAADRATLDDLAAHGADVGPDALDWRSDPGAAFASVRRHDLAALPPQVAAPHSPANSADVAAHAGEPVTLAYVGACVGAKLDDLAMAAEVLRGRRVARGVRLLVAPASADVAARAARSGALASLLDAGAELLPSGCGACAGMGPSRLGPGEVCISTTNRNYRGRMGDASARVYLASPYTVAASAVAGRILDPRELLAHRRAA